MKEKTAKSKKRWQKTLPVFYLLALIVVTWVGIFAVRLAGPPNIGDNDQERPAAYVLDVLVNGDWIVQRDDTGDITSKPPLYTWVTALTAKAYGKLDEFSLYLPGALCVLIVALLIHVIGESYFGRNAGAAGALAYLLSIAAFKQAHLARTDALFALTVVVTAILAYAAARRRV